MSKVIINSDDNYWQSEAMGGAIVHLVYEKRVTDGDIYGVFYRQRNSGGAWGLEQLLSASGFYAETPTVSVRAQHVHVCWRERTGDKSRTFLVETDSYDGGKTWE